MKKGLKNRHRSGSRVEVILQQEFFLKLVRMALQAVPFDEAYYISEHPDVAASIASGKIKSGKEHYVNIGYFENRLPRRIDINENDYLNANPDLKKAYADGHITSLMDHFIYTGIQEGRQPKIEFNIFI